MKTTMTLLSLLVLCLTGISSSARANDKGRLVIRNTDTRAYYVGIQRRNREITISDRLTGETDILLQPNESLRLAVREDDYRVRWLGGSRSASIEVEEGERSSIRLVRPSPDKLVAEFREDGDFERTLTLLSSDNNRRQHHNRRRRRSYGSLTINNESDEVFDITINESSKTIALRRKHRGGQMGASSRTTLKLEAATYRLTFEDQSESLLVPISPRSYSHVTLRQGRRNDSRLVAISEINGSQIDRVRWTLNDCPCCEHNPRGNAGHHSQEMRLQAPGFGEGPVTVLVPVPGHPSITLYAPDARFPQGRAFWPNNGAYNPTIKVYSPMPGYAPLTVKPLVSGHPSFVILPPAENIYQPRGRCGTNSRRQEPVVNIYRSKRRKSTNVNIAPLIRLFQSAMNN